MKQTLALALALLSLTASASTQDVITPIDEENLGYLLVSAPSSAPSVAPYQVRMRTNGSGEVTLGTPKRLLAGPTCLALDSPLFSGALSDCGIQVTARQTTRYALSGLRLFWSHEGLESTFGPRAEFKITGPGGAVNPNGPTQPVQGPALAGAYKAELFPSDLFVDSPPLEWTLARDEIKDVTIDFGRLNANVVIEYGARVLPDAPLRCSGGSNAYLVWRDLYHLPYAERVNLWQPTPEQAANGSPGGYMREYRHVSRERQLEYRVFPLKDSGSRYELVLNNVPLVLQPERGHETRVVLKRIDVNHVRVTRENGSAYEARGTYEIHRADPAQAGQWIRVAVPAASQWSCPLESDRRTDDYRSFPTGTGLDVLPGYYKVVVNYVTEEGPRSQQFLLDLTN
jgi:hypothetical protein